MIGITVCSRMRSAGIGPHGSGAPRRLSLVPPGALTVIGVLARRAAAATGCKALSWLPLARYRVRDPSWGLLPARAREVDRWRIEMVTAWLKRFFFVCFVVCFRAFVFSWRCNIRTSASR